MKYIFKFAYLNSFSFSSRFGVASCLIWIWALCQIYVFKYTMLIDDLALTLFMANFLVMTFNEVNFSILNWFKLSIFSFTCTDSFLILLKIFANLKVIKTYVCSKICWHDTFLINIFIYVMRQEWILFFPYVYWIDSPSFIKDYFLPNTLQ